MKTQPQTTKLPDIAELLPAVEAWAAEISAQASQNGRLLTQEEKEFAGKIGITNQDDIHIWTVGAMPPIPAELKAVSKEFLDISTAAGLTLGHNILIARGHERPSLIRHELMHVLQVERMEGVKNFLKLYMEQILAFGYHNAPFEIEARRCEGE